MEKKLSFGKSLIIIGFLLLSIFVGVIIWEQDPQIPIVLATVFATVFAMVNGIKWEALEKSIIENIVNIVPSIVFLLAMGIMLGTWLHSGVVPTIIYYGSKIISPKLLIPTTFLLASATSLTTGDSWGTAGTIGIALLGIGISFGIPAPIMAGAIVSGSYFGDKLSPISDTTVLAAGVSEVDVFEHVKYMLWTTVPSMLIATVVYFFLGLKHAGNVDLAQISELHMLLEETFTISPILLLVPVSVIVMIAKKVNPVPALMGGALLAAVFAMIFQGASLAEVVEVMHYGVELDTGYELIDELIAGGGLDYVMWTISLVLVAMTLAGVLDASGVTEAIVGRILRLVRNTGDLILATVVSSIFLNIATADQYLAIIFPAKMFKETYKEKNLDLRVLSRTLEDAGTLTSPLFAWNTCGAFISGALGVSPLAYLPYAILNWLNPIIAIIYGYTGFSIKYTNEEVVAEGSEE
ncbi:MAG: Na+/H+ antiporter NhaC [Synergistaceae bacterium]|nr:Na+/H+ antiporter NhaC [Synergistaceae bacterium]